MRPEDVLPDGVDVATVGGAEVRKGTVGAFLGSVRAWRDPGLGADERAAAERDILALLPALRATGLLDVLEPKGDDLRDLLSGRRTSS